MVWSVILKHNQNGETIEGSKEKLLSYIGKGFDIKISILADPLVGNKATICFPAVLFINHGEVFAQVSWMASTWRDPDRETMFFESPPADYILCLSTSGKSSRRFIKMPDGTVDDETQRTALCWFVDV